jgi:hypothetical protein
MCGNRLNSENIPQANSISVATQILVSTLLKRHNENIPQNRTPTQIRDNIEVNGIGLNAHFRVSVTRNARNPREKCRVKCQYQPNRTQYDRGIVVAFFS